MEINYAKRYEEEWLVNQRLQARIQELEETKGFEGMQVARLEQRLQMSQEETKSVQSKLDKLRKKNTLLREQMAKVKEDNVLLEAAVKSQDTLRTLNAKLLEELQWIRVAKNQQDLLVVAQHDVICRQKTILRANGVAPGCAK